MKVLIAEDDVASRKILKHMIKHLADFQVVGEAKTGEELIHKVLSEKPDIALVDINMPLLNGMEAVKSCKIIHPSIQVVFITGHDEFALEAFGVNAIDYILKPIQMERLYTALGRAAALARQNTSAAPAPVVTKDLMIKQYNNYSFVAMEDIVFIERADRKSVIHTIDKRIELNEALTNLEELLDSRFVASHRSFIINLQYLVRIEAYGQSYKAHFKNYSETARVSKHKLPELQKSKSL